MATIIKNIFAYWQHVLNAEENSLLYNYAFPTGSVYGFGIKWRQGQQQRQRRTPASSESASNIKILHIVYKAGLFHILYVLYILKIFNF